VATLRQFLSLVEQALDAVSAPVLVPVVQDLGLAGAFGWDDRLDPVEAQFLADRVGIVAFVGQHRPDPFGDHLEQGGEALRVMGLARRQDEADRPTSAVASGMDFGREAAPRAPECLPILIPLFMPTAQWCARITVLSIICASRSGLAKSAKLSRSASNTPVATQRRYRRNTLFHLPYSSGRRRHCEPERAIHSMPSK